jgi:hypothetical protein
LKKLSSGAIVASTLLEQAAEQYKNGDRAGAGMTLANLLRQEPGNARAWFALSACLDENKKKRECLTRALALDPNYERAQKALEKLDAAPVEMIGTFTPAISTFTPEPTFQNPVEPAPNEPEVPQTVSPQTKAPVGKVNDMLASLPDDSFALYEDFGGRYGVIEKVVVCRQGGVMAIALTDVRGRVSIANNKLMIDKKQPETDLVTETLRGALKLQEEVDHFLGQKPWITAMLVFTNSSTAINESVRGIFLISPRYLIKEIQNRCLSRQLGPILWEKRERLFGSL